ncbi:hypothetical protein ATANTOWER_006366, partial [Ataeniobius toweri]|nr:hypothetical protein [Ataeniobius toweri]
KPYADSGFPLGKNSPRQSSFGPTPTTAFKLPLHYLNSLPVCSPTLSSWHSKDPFLLCSCHILWRPLTTPHVAVRITIPLKLHPPILPQPSRTLIA